ncbi:MAG: hypothetical protein ABIH46_09565, partial [Chloroflexota bacterium]
LKFFYEFRDLFRQLSSVHQFTATVQGVRATFMPASSISDINELFCNLNQRDLEIQLGLQAMYAIPKLPVPVRLDITIPRATNNWLAKAQIANEMVDAEQGATFRRHGTSEGRCPTCRVRLRI